MEMLAKLFHFLGYNLKCNPENKCTSTCSKQTLLHHLFVYPFSETTTTAPRVAGYNPSRFLWEKAGLHGRQFNLHSKIHKHLHSHLYLQTLFSWPFPLCKVKKNPLWNTRRAAQCFCVGLVFTTPAGSIRLVPPTSPRRAVHL